MMMLTQNNNQLMLEGEWTIGNTPIIEKSIAAIDWTKLDLSNAIEINGSALTSLDTSGAYWMGTIVKALKAKNGQANLTAFHGEFANLVNFISDKMNAFEPDALDDPKKDPFFVAVGKRTYLAKDQTYRFFDFIGQVAMVTFKNLAHPWSIRWKTMWSNVQTGGVQALFIIGLLNFLIGIVIAYQGGALLKQYGANIFVVELISISMLRELAPLMTAIIVAGRTGSAIAAQIGTMVVNEEVDALSTIGINPLDQLVVPKMLALIIALPFLTVFADVCSVFGGMVLANTYLDVSFSTFVERIPQVMTVDTLLVGLAKTPLFAIIISLTGCYQGFRVSGGADSVGQQTTISVVQSIFLVIICDAIFSIITRNVPI
ncbi:MlaE family ABC transporter permease [Wohlfahrtiimonas chitiniclastica]|uniref:MlaE family ABC transporter permease n=1 Tax=Wohlfahrtiimonas chitiniclastica TaxID=400946 RepID=UPI001FF055C2|nr:ABC transporter permease [Wohlfahrtiimonas chitiniclastica]